MATFEVDNQLVEIATEDFPWESERGDRWIKVRMLGIERLFLTIDEAKLLYDTLENEINSAKTKARKYGALKSGEGS